MRRHRHCLCRRSPPLTAAHRRSPPCPAFAPLPFPAPVCCAGKTHCCASGYSCVNSNLTCQADAPQEHPLATWTLQWNLCRGPMPLAHMPAVPGLAFPYFSSVGDVQRPEASVAQKIRAAVVVVHGAGRNADEYYCSMREAVRLQTRYTDDAVAVVAPWFRQSNDDVPSGTVFWDGSDPNGVWRAGLNSVPGGTANASVSSYTMLDRILTALNATDVYPNLELVTLVCGGTLGPKGPGEQSWAPAPLFRPPFLHPPLSPSFPLFPPPLPPTSQVGHSSGGQTVQRYTLTQQAKRLGGAAKRPHFRYIVANPSSFAYLDARRWVDGSLAVPPASTVNSCPEYNAWEWGLDGNFPPYAQGVPPQHFVATYADKDVVYLAGLNDTCNEDLVPGCHSHGLEKTCMDMLEGPFRLKRAQLYFEYLAELYDRPVHRFVGVPNTSHDHVSMFQQPPGLAAIFGPPSGGCDPTPRASLLDVSNTGLIMGIALLVVCTLVLALLAYRWGRSRRDGAGGGVGDLRSMLTVRYHRVDNASAGDN